MKTFTSHSAALLVKKKTLLAYMKDYSIDLRVFPFNDVEKRFYYVIIDNNKYLMPVAFSIDMRHEKIFEKSYSEIKDLVKEKDLQEFIVTIKTNNLENV